MALRIGVLALQGAFAEHVVMLGRLGVDPVEVRLPPQLSGLDALIIPGGESTSISLLMSEYGFLAPVENMAKSGFPVWGTCAGLIVLSRLTPGSYPHTMQVMDIEVKRNAFGRQVDSFETDLHIPGLGPDAFHGIFIRAPRISKVGAAVDVLCKLPDGEPVAARQGKLLCCSFHPELGNDTRFHRYFVDMVTTST
ncbi:MAG: pyridoxal 5'-phosphate synthase glutaminase subunit PdxT [Chloroflexi bacterium]|nr:pyridoxal 5'-phosphate synthase glutaminase subunit PdxT [Chloroflexota bacterium]